MSSDRARLLRFLLALALLLAGAEALVRAGEPLLVAAGNRGQAKLRLLARQGRVDALFVGLSRTQDGVSPRVFAAELAAGGLETASFASFNLGFTSTNLDSLEALAERVAARPGVRLFVVELSEPQLNGGPSILGDGAAPEDRALLLEDRLAAAARRHVALLRERAALVPENLARLPALLSPAGRLDGSEVTLAAQLGALLGWTGWEPAAIGAPWPAPPLVQPSPASGGAPLSPEVARQAERLEALARRLGADRVVFAVPPLSTGGHETDRDVEREPAFQALLARLARTAPVLDGSRLPGPRELFHNPSHLNHRGRAAWSRALARALAGRFGA